MCIRDSYQAGRALRRLAVSHVALTRLWRFETEGAPPEGPRRPYVVVSNHESYADIFLVSHFPWEMKWLSKHTIFKIPVMGWMMRMALDVPVRRGQRESAIAALAECRDRLARRVSVMIFPEGTRTRTDELLPPIDTDGLTLADAADLRERTRATIDAARRALQRELDASPA